MKKTFNINLGDIVFHIDEDAYELLDKYLSNLRIHFSKEEGAEEIVHDMELRISELFSERLHESKQVISIADVEEVIGQMGKPEEFSEDATQDTQTYTEEKGTRRLYRNPDDKVIGGVCSGIAAYMGWDVTLVRLFTLVFGFLFQGIIVAYIISWILIPEAQTATEILSMKGMKVNVENIGKTVTDNFENVNDYIKSCRTVLVYSVHGILLIADGIHRYYSRYTGHPFRSDSSCRLELVYRFAYVGNLVLGLWYLAHRFAYFWHHPCVDEHIFQLETHVGWKQNHLCGYLVFCLMCGILLILFVKCADCLFNP